MSPSVLIHIVVLTLFANDSTGSERIVLEDPFVIRSNETVSHLYDVIKAKVSYPYSSHGTSIIIGKKLILDLYDGHRTIKDIEISNGCTGLFDIQVILKPDVAALLEMVMDIRNARNIPWFKKAIQSLDAINDSSAIYDQCQNESMSWNGLEYDDNGYLIGIDLSHLKLVGTIHLECLPQSVRSLDLSFNDLDSLDLSGLKGKSVERLNVEHNKRCHLNINTLLYETEQPLKLEELQISSNQIYPWITEQKEKNSKIREWSEWMIRHDAKFRLIVNEWDIVQGIHKSGLELYSQMLRVVRAVTNKERIPWYGFEGRMAYGVDYRRTGKHKSNGKYRFDLSSHGLEGTIDLGSLPRNVRVLDVSNNSLSTILFGDARNRSKLYVLHIQNNDNLRMDLQTIDELRMSALNGLAHLSLSSNQLMKGGMPHHWHGEYARTWLESSALKTITIDGNVFQTEGECDKQSRIDQDIAKRKIESCLSL